MDFIESERKENIFYGDIFKIGGCGCLFFGSGKSRAGSAVSDDQIALDFACLTRGNNDLYGHFEMKFRGKGVEDPINERIKIDYLVKMLDENETKLKLGKKLEVVEIDLNKFIEESEFNITFNINPIIPIPTKDESKIEKFDSLVNGCNIKCILVPWMNSHEEKGNLLKSFILGNSK